MSLSKLFLTLALTSNLLTLCQVADNEFNYLFVHGLGGDKNQIRPYTDYKIIKRGISFHAFNGPEVQAGSFFQSCLGQEGDINVIAKTIKANKISKPIIGVGVSKGAATLINIAGSQAIPNIKALVLESPFANASEVVKNHKIVRSLGLGFIFGGDRMAKWSFPNYKPDGIQPIKLVNKIQHDVPIIIFHSKKDALIDIDHSRKLYIELIKEKRNNVYLIETENGDHANIIWSKTKENLFVVNVVHEFYKKHNLPYYPELIKNIDLKKFQPSLKEIEKKLKTSNSSTISRL